MVRRALVVVAAVAMVAACKPEDAASAEARGDIAWLDANGSPEAVAALGRIADNNTHAVDLLNARAVFDGNAYIAAWNAMLRGATWGPALLRDGLADPTRAEAAASAMTRKDGHLATFVPDLDAALVRLAAGQHSVAIAAVLASAGPAASLTIQHRLEDATTRGSMCRGIGAPDASADARRTLMSVPTTSRDDESCVEAALKMAVDNDAALDWLATTAEPGLLGAAGKSEEFPCPRLRILWTKALPVRSPALHAALTVPLAGALKRCAPSMDPVLATALAHEASARSLVVAAIDPYGGETVDLRATCEALKSVASGGRDSLATRTRAEDAVSHACRTASK
jgi:hypothetical protein